MSSFKTTKELLLDKQAWPLEKKIEHTLKRICEFYESVDGKAYICFSGGKDSQVLLHLVRSVYPKMLAVFSNTGNEKKQIVKNVKKFNNVEWVSPSKTMKEIFEKEGFPLVSKNVSRGIPYIKYPSEKSKNVRNLYMTGYNRKGVYCPSWKIARKWMFLSEQEFDLSNKCCYYLKEEPMKRFEKETGLNPIVGTMASESGRRTTNYIQYGCNIYEGKNIKSRPLSIWTEDDIWAYAELNGLRFAECYYDRTVNGQVIEGDKRTGCEVCGFGADQEKGQGRFDVMKIESPKKFDYWMNKVKNNGVSFAEALRAVGVVI